MCVARGQEQASPLLSRDVFPDAESWRGNGFTPAARTTAWACEPGSVAEGVRAILTFRGFQQKGSRGIVSQRFYNVREMILHLSLRHAKELGQLVRGQQGAGQQRDHPSPGCLVR